MTLTLELTPEQQEKLDAEAIQHGMDTATFALSVLTGNAATLPAPKKWSGADLVAYWEREGLIGSRPEIIDSLEHVCAIRRKADLIS